MDQEDAKLKKWADSQTSFLEDDADCLEKSATKLGEDVILDAKNGDSSLISESMAEEEARLLGARLKEERAGRLNKPDRDAELNDSQFTKLDELLSQTKALHGVPIGENGRHYFFFVETLDKCFKNVYGLDIVFNYDKMQTVLDEMILSRQVLETNSAEVTRAVEGISKLEAASSVILLVPKSVSSWRSR